MNGRIINATTIILVLIFLAVTVTAVALYVQLRTDSVSAALSGDEAVRVLIVAHEEGDPFLSFLLFYDSRTSRAAVIDIPRSVGAVLRPLGRVDGIDAIFDPDDPSAYRREVESLTGVTIPFVVLFPEDKLIDFIDLIGGLELFVIRDYRDLEGSDPVLLPSGSARLDGEKAVSYLREQPGSDVELEQVGRRQAFVTSFLREIQRNAPFLRHRDVVPVRDGMINTEIETRALDSLFAAVGTINTDQIVRRRIQGAVREVDVAGTSRSLLFPHFEGRWLRQAVEQIQQTLQNPVYEGEEGVPIAIEVLNGTNRTGLARQTSELFEGFGFLVRNVDNAESNRIEHTVVIDRRGMGDLAEQVAEVISARRVVTEVTPDSDVDVTVVLGGDFDGTRVRSD